MRISCVNYESLRKSLLNPQKNLLVIKANYPFKKTFKKITKAKKIDFVFVEKANINQMFALLISRISGKKFIWIQAFSNPPTPNILARILLNQTDTILLSSKKLAGKLRGLGVDKPKIRIYKKS